MIHNRTLSPGSYLRRWSTGLIGALLLAASLTVISAPAGALTPAGPVVPPACNPGGGSGVDVFNGSMSNQWGTAQNWSSGSIPGPGDFVCIPEAYGQQVELSGGSAQIVGVNDESSAGLEFVNSGLTLTGTNEPSVINSFDFVGSGDPSNLDVDAGAVLDLTGSGTIYQSEPVVNGPGRINSIKGSTTSLGPDLGFADSLRWDNWGTLTGVGASLCPSSSQAVELINEAKAKMVLNSGGGFTDSAPWCNSSLTVLPIVLNDSKASIVVSGGAFEMGAPFDNKGTVVDEYSSNSGLGSGLSISSNSGANGTDTGTYETKSSVTKGLGEINFDAPRDLTSAALTGSGTFGFYAINGGVDLADPTLASVNQTGTTNGGMTITKNLTFYYSELGYNIQTDTGTPTTTVIDSGASVNFSNWGAMMENGHNLVIDSGATFNLASESLCLSPTSKVTNSGQFIVSGDISPSVSTCGGGSGGAFANTATGSVSDSASNAGIDVPFTNTGSVQVTAGSFTVDGSSGKTDTGSWKTASGTTLAFASGLSTVTGGFSGAGTVTVDCYTTLGFSGQSLKNLFIAGETTGDYKVIGALSMTTENECTDYPTFVIPSGTVSITGNFTPQQYEAATVELTVNGAGGSALSVGQLDVAGTATLSSSTAATNLSIATSAGVTPAVGQSAQIVTAGTTVGDFTLSTTCAGPGVAYQVAPDSTGISLNVVSNGSCT